MDFAEHAGNRIASGSDCVKSLLRVLSVGSDAAFMANRVLFALPGALRISPSDTLDDILSFQSIEPERELCGLNRTHEFRVLCSLWAAGDLGLFENFCITL